MIIHKATTGYKVSPQHLDSQYRIADLLDRFFKRVYIECDTPVPNPQVIQGDMDANRTKPYDLDVYAEDPRDFNLPILAIGVEINCHKGHDNTKKQHKRDKARKDQIKDFYRIDEIYTYSCKDLIGKDPKLTDELLLKEWRLLSIIPSQQR